MAHKLTEQEQAIVVRLAKLLGKELPAQQVFDLFKKEYIDATKPYELLRHSFQEETVDGHSRVTFRGTLRHTDTVFPS